jgi:hypothetical protein
LESSCPQGQEEKNRRLQQEPERLYPSILHEKFFVRIQPDPHEALRGVTSPRDRWNTGIIGPGEFRRISPVGDIRDLSRSEGDHPVRWTVSEEGVEIVKIPAAGPEDNHPSGFGAIFLMGQVHRIIHGRGRNSFS